MKVFGNLDSVGTAVVKGNSSKKSSKTNKNIPTQNEDSVELSSEINSIKEYKTLTKDLKGIRESKVNDIKLLVNDGTYRISNEKIAEKIIEENLIN